MSFFSTNSLIMPESTYLLPRDDGDFIDRNDLPDREGGTEFDPSDPFVGGGSDDGPGTSSGGGPTPSREQGTSGAGSTDTTGSPVLKSLENLIPLALFGAALYFLFKK
jgi:hypothetical protein